jgi:hypothetical protein
MARLGCSWAKLTEGRFNSSNTYTSILYFSVTFTAGIVLEHPLSLSHCFHAHIVLLCFVLGDGCNLQLEHTFAFHYSTLANWMGAEACTRNTGQNDNKKTPMWSRPCMRRTVFVCARENDARHFPISLASLIASRAAVFNGQGFS